MNENKPSTRFASTTSFFSVGGLGLALDTSNFTPSHGSRPLIRQNYQQVVDHVRSVVENLSDHPKPVLPHFW
jgi:hypothetical protein